MITRIEGMADNHALVLPVVRMATGRRKYLLTWRMARTTSPLQPGIWRATAHITPQY